MNRCLRHESVGEGKPNDTANEAGTAEKEEVPMEAGGLLERVLTGLCGEG